MRTLGTRAWWPSALALAMLVGWHAAPARAQTVPDCQPDQYVDRTSSAAVRQLTWDFCVQFNPARCMQVQVGQTVAWLGDLGMHPLAPDPPDDTSSPVFFQSRDDSGASVVFNTVGTFKYQRNAHPNQMRGAIKVVQALPPSVPALSPWLVMTMAALLCASGLMIVKRRSRQ